MKTAAAVTALTGLVLLTACSGSGSSTVASKPSAPVPTTAPATSPGSPSSASSASSSSSASSAQQAVPAEKNPPGDIPDDLAFVAYSNASGRYRFTHPEGWAETTSGGAVTFTDKLNGVHVEPGAATAALAVASVRQQDVPALQRTQPAFELRDVTAVTVPAGSGVKVVYRRNAAPDAVTGRQYRDEVERYELVAAGREVVVELFGPVGADNVDAYRTMVQSLRLL